MSYISVEEAMDIKDNIHEYANLIKEEVISIKDGHRIEYRVIYDDTNDGQFKSFIYKDNLLFYNKIPVSLIDINKNDGSLEVMYKMHNADKNDVDVSQTSIF